MKLFEIFLKPLVKASVNQWIIKYISCQICFRFCFIVTMELNIKYWIRAAVYPSFYVIVDCVCANIFIDLTRIAWLKGVFFLTICY